MDHVVAIILKHNHLTCQVGSRPWDAASLDLNSQYALNSQAMALSRPKVVITGGNGVLGQRLAEHLLLREFHLVLLDDYDGFHKGVKRDPAPQQVLGSFEHVQADLCNWGDWHSCFEGADAVVHFSAVNPYPEASWEDSRLSMRMSANVVAASQRAGVRRLVVASSSHVLGGYMQTGVRRPTAAALEPGTPLRHFTRFRLPGFETDASGYASAKLALEEMTRAAAMATRGLSAVIIRIGWCQPGENLPQNMTATATPTVSADKVAKEMSVEDEVAAGFDNRDEILAWLHRIWLSTPDFKHLFERAIDADIEGCLTVFGMSENSGMRWSCAEGWSQLGYKPADDAQRTLDELKSRAAKRAKLG